MRQDGLRILHAIHDFLPRHQAGSEIYAFELSRALAARHHVTVLCAEYDPSRRHGHLTWRLWEGLPVVELVNNWIGTSFSDTYRSPLITDQIAHVLAAVQPDVIHLHSLLNLSFDLPAIASAMGVPVVATLHDYTLVCASGGQRVHRAENHRCDEIDTARCARCFGQSSFHAQMSLGRVAAMTARSRSIGRAAVALKRRLPMVAAWLARAVAQTPIAPVTAGDLAQRLTSARTLFDQIDLFVAPSKSIATEFQQLGLDPAKVRVRDYGFTPLSARARTRNGGPLRIGYVGTLVWHKGVHVLVDAVRSLSPTSYRLSIFGDPTVFPDYSAELRTKAAGLPVHFMGRFDRAQIADAYAAMDVLVVPSLWLENSPLVIHEAFMAGVPVVGAAIGGIPGLVSHGKNGLLYPADSSAALAGALRGLIEQPGRLDELAGAVRYVKSMAEDARDWEATYFEVMHRRAPTGRVQ